MISNLKLQKQITDILPNKAYSIEKLRNKLLNYFYSYGYKIVITPLFEYLETLIIDGKINLYSNLIKFSDQISGRTLCVRSDITPQITRVDLNINNKCITRLCYAGNILNNKTKYLYSTKEKIQIGLEIYGHIGIESDIETQKIMINSLKLSGFKKIRLHLCHSIILKSLIKQEPILYPINKKIYKYLYKKDIFSLKKITKNLPYKKKKILNILPNLYGDIKILEKARLYLPKLKKISNALNDILMISINTYNVIITIDLSNFENHLYYNGIMFTAYINNISNYIAIGGRYNKISKLYGHSRPATGFSINLNNILRSKKSKKYENAILSPFINKYDQQLLNIIKKLRKNGKIIIQEFPKQNIMNNKYLFNKILIKYHKKWIIQNKF